jgi:threonine/homoserine/homoserine lactone efflux protein
MSLELYLAYVLACVVVAVVPGPIVTLIVANSVAHGARAGLLNMAGAQLGNTLVVGIVVVGLASILATMSWWFDWLRLAGAAYLVWIGWKLLRSPGVAELPSVPRGGFVLQGFLVLLSNPKALLFFGAFIPQFVDPQGDYVAQVVLLGGTFMVVAAVSDGAYAVLAGRARAMVAGRHARLVARLGGCCLIGGGVWLALARAR